MGWRSKLIFLMIVYFAGFATAVYYLAPGSRPEGGYPYGPDGQSSDTGIFANLYDKASAKACAGLSGMNSEEFKEKFRLGMQKLMEMAQSSRTNASRNTAIGGED
ncbi:MAG: hypothetical protein PHP01_01465 [Phycisphaerae bacterium]|nr:hypothetical protein [Phycisphaerae bacterium]